MSTTRHPYSDGGYHHDRKGRGRSRADGRGRGGRGRGRDGGVRREDGVKDVQIQQRDLITRSLSINPPSPTIDRVGWVREVEDLYSLEAALEKEKEFGLSVQPEFIFLTTKGKDYYISSDLKPFLNALHSVLNNPQIIKIFHRSDVEVEALLSYGLYATPIFGLGMFSHFFSFFLFSFFLFFFFSFFLFLSFSFFLFYFGTDPLPKVSNFCSPFLFFLVVLEQNVC